VWDDVYWQLFCLTRTTFYHFWCWDLEDFDAFSREQYITFVINKRLSHHHLFHPCSTTRTPISWATRFHFTCWSSQMMLENPVLVHSEREREIELKSNLTQSSSHYNLFGGIFDQHDTIGWLEPQYLSPLTTWTNRCISHGKYSIWLCHCTASQESLFSSIAQPIRVLGHTRPTCRSVLI
jgi:hypothetical protein